MSWQQLIDNVIFYICVAVCVFAFFRYVIGSKR